MVSRRRHLWAVACAVALGQLTPVAAQAERLWIENVQVVDVTAGIVRPAQRIVIEDGTILAVDDMARTPATARGAVVDGRGAYVIPGLLDMHAHFGVSEPAARQAGPLFVANGVTGVRLMFGGCHEPCGPFEPRIAQSREVARAVASGALMAPRVLRIGSAMIDGPISPRSGKPTPRARDVAYPPRDPAEARALAHYWRGQGADFLKVYDGLPRREWLALLDEARRIGLEVSGHEPTGVSLSEMAAAGQRTVEHARALPVACSTFAQPFAEMGEAVISGTAPWSEQGRVRTHASRFVATFDPARCDRVIADLKAHGVYLVPTHITRRMDAFANDPDYRADPRLAYVLRPMRPGWLADIDEQGAYNTASGQSFMEFYLEGLRLTGRAHRAGVRVMLGSDAYTAFSFPGFSAHDELRELTRAGLTPLDALRAATMVPAEYLGMAGKVGVVAPGAHADLVLLDADPLASIEATARIRAVVFRGEMLDRARLDQMLATARAQANSDDYLRTIAQAAGLIPGPPKSSPGARP